MVRNHCLTFFAESFFLIDGCAKIMSFKNTYSSVVAVPVGRMGNISL